MTTAVNTAVRQCVFTGCLRLSIIFTYKDQFLLTKIINASHYPFNYSVPDETARDMHVLEYTTSYQGRELVGQQLQSLPSFFKVVVPVIDTLYAFDRMIKAAFGHMPGNTERCQ